MRSEKPCGSSPVHSGAGVLTCCLLLPAFLFPAASGGAEDPLGELRREAEAIAALPGEPSVRESMGVSARDRILDSLESRVDLAGPQRRLAIVAGLDGDERGVAAALGALRWFKTRAPDAVRREWNVTAVPCGNPDGFAQAKPTNDTGGKPAVNYPPTEGFFNHSLNVEGRYLWRWLSFQAPDLVLVIGGGRRITWRVPPGHQSLGAGLGALPLVAPDSLSMSLSRDSLSGMGSVPSLSVEARSEDGPAVLQAALRAGERLGRSPLRETCLRRLARSPGEVAALLAARYPREASIAYIPAVAWTGTLRLGRKLNDQELVEKARAAARPYLAGRPALDGDPGTARLAGYILFADLAEAAEAGERDSLRRLALEGADRYLPEQPDGLPRYGRSWTDDMFMTCCLLGRAGRLSGDRPYHDVMARMLVAYAGKLQRPDGIFIHSPNGPHAWGRGNGFASLGLMEGLTFLAPAHPLRAPILEAYRKQMAALRGLQSPEGAWRQVIDRRESYREVTATAMNLAAMARGLRLGWLDPSYRPTVERAWRSLLPRIAEDASLVDVCTGTGAGPNLRYYYERAAITGHDDRGGAMCLLAALEVGDLPPAK